MRHVSEFRVRYAETDQMGVVYHANYLVWCEIGRTDLIRALGTSYAEVEQDGVTLAVADARLRFQRGARYDDVVQVVTTIVEVGSRGVKFEYKITLTDGTPLAVASTVLIAVGREGKGRTLPVHLRQAMEHAIES